MADLKVFLEVLNSSFSTSLVGSLAGAFGGAYAAQKIADRAKLKDQILSELRHLNAAVAISFGVTNTALMAKGQHILPLFDEYVAEIERYRTREQTGVAAGVRGVYELRMNLVTIPHLSIATDSLKGLVLSSVQVSSKVINLFTSLEDYLNQLNNAIDYRHRLIQDIREGKLPQGAGPEHIYLGIPFGNGHSSVEYGATLDAMRQYVDNVIFYSATLAQELFDRGKVLQEEYRKRFSDPAPDVSSIDLSIAKERGLWPSEEKYADWLSAFQKAEKKASSNH